MATNSFEERGRGEKVARIVQALDAGAETAGLDPIADAEEIARKLRALTDAEWLKVAQEAGCKRKKPPSVLTQGMVIAVYSRRVDVAREEVA